MGRTDAVLLAMLRQQLCDLLQILKVLILEEQCVQHLQPLWLCSGLVAGRQHRLVMQLDQRRLELAQSPLHGHTRYRLDAWQLQPLAR